MDPQPFVFSGTLRARTCHLFWLKTPVHLTYHRQDYRQALPVLLIRRSNIRGGEERIPLDPCIHPVQCLPVSKRMASRLEFTLKYGWHTKQVCFRAPDARAYHHWTSLVRTALESGRRPLARYDSVTTDERQRTDFKCSSLVSIINSSSNGNSKAYGTIRQAVTDKNRDDQSHFDPDIIRRQKEPSCDFLFDSNHSKYQFDALPAQDDNIRLSNFVCTNAANGSCSCENDRRIIHLTIGEDRLSQSLRARFKWSGITHELCLRASAAFYFLL